MAQLFVIDSSYVQDELRGTSELVKVRVLNVHTVNDLIYWQDRVDLPATIGTINAYLESKSIAIETIAQNPSVIAMQYEQDVNAAGQLIDVFEIFVQSTSGRSTSSFTHNYNALDPTVVGPLIDQQVALLDSLEAL